MTDILLAIGITIVLLFILALLFYFVTKRVNVLLKKIYVTKLQEFDFLIEEKEHKIDELNGTIEKNKKEKDTLISEIEELEEKKKRITVIERNVTLPVHRDYEDTNIIESYRKIRSKFKIDPKAFAKDFVKEHPENPNNNYDRYVSIRNKLTHKIVYKISTYDEETQKTIINGILNRQEVKLIQNLLNKKKFSIIKFTNELDELIREENPKILIYVGNKRERYNNIDKRIETIYDENIMEGIKIEYKGKIYDYSL